MKGNQKIIDGLNKMLTYELTSVNQYFIHSEMYADWGLTKLYERIKHESEDERLHAQAIIKRILFLEGIPNAQDLNTMKIGSNVPTMLESDLDLEKEGRVLLQDLIELCENEKDYVTREMLLGLLKDTEEDHILWLEIQLKLIKNLGLENYLSEQM